MRLSGRGCWLLSEVGEWDVDEVVDEVVGGVGVGRAEISTRDGGLTASSLRNIR